MRKLPDDIVMYQLKQMIIFTVWIIGKSEHYLLIYFRKIREQLKF